MQLGRILGLVVGGFVALLALLLLSVWIFVDPNNYKPRIVSAVEEATGRKLQLPGDIKLSVFPWIALQLGPASLGNPPGFGDQPFVSFKRATFRARLLPLLARRLELGRVEIDGLEARLVRNAAGRGNWEGMGKPAGAGAQAAADDADTGEALAGIAGVKITGARVSYGRYAIDNLNIETGAFAQSELMPVTITFDANRGVATEHASVAAQFDFSGDVAARLYRVAALAFHGTVTLAGNPRPVRWNFSTPTLDLNLATQRVSAPAFALDLAGAQLSGSLVGSQVIDAPALSGRVSLTPLIVREFLPRLGLTAPRTRDPRALSLVTASFAYGYGAGRATLDDLKITVDDTHLTGSAAIVNLQTRALKFALAVDALDLDRYLAPEGDPAEVKAPPSTAAPGGATQPVEANGSLTVASLHVTPLDLTAVKVTVAATGGVIHLFPLQAQVDGGQYAGNVVLDDRDSVPLLTLDEHLTGIEVGRLVSTDSRNVHVSGRGNVSLRATGRGADADALLKTLNGHLDAVVTNGAVEGVDVGFQLARAEALIRGQDAATLQDTKRTKFDAFKMSADILNGVAQSKDLTITSAVLKVTGQGSVKLPTRNIDFSLLADTLRTAGGTPIQIPLKLTGSAADPTVRPDLDALAKGQLRQKVQEVLQDKLKALFNR